MTIDIAIKKMTDVLPQEPYKYAESEEEKNFEQAFRMVITAANKYQKIEDIVRAYYNDEYADKIDIEVIEMISEVLCGID